MPSSKQLSSSSSKHKPRTRHSSVESVMSTSADSDTQRVKNVSLATKKTSKSSPKVDLLFILFFWSACLSWAWWWFQEREKTVNQCCFERYSINWDAPSALNNSSYLVYYGSCYIGMVVYKFSDKSFSILSLNPIPFSRSLVYNPWSLLLCS